MAQSMVNFRLDSDVKKGMEDACKSMGISMSAAFVMFATKVSRERRIPFEITADPFYLPSNIDALKDSISQLENGQIVRKTIKELEDMTDGKPDIY